VPKGDVPGEWYSPTQPFPTKPPAYARQAVTVDELIDFTPDMRAQALKNFQMYKTGPMFLPPAVSVAGGPLAALTIGTLNGGTNWPGAGYDPETHVVYAPASNAALAPIGLVEPPKEFGSDLRYVMGTAGQPFVEREGPGFGSAADAPQRRPVPIPLPQTAGAPAAAGRGGRGAGAAAAGGGNPLVVDGLPLVKPPYGLLSAINLDRGEMMWQVAHGETPDNVRNHPALKGLNVPRTGQSGAVGLVVTKTLVIMGDPQVTTTMEHPRGAMLRAYDKSTGKEVGAVWMPAPQSGSPMTYMVNGKQYIVVAVSGGNYSGEYIAFSVPDDARTTN
jgi:quinoprotein glucose dehydrogenase